MLPSDGTPFANKPEVEGDDFVKRLVVCRASGLSSAHDAQGDDDDGDDDDKERTLKILEVFVCHSTAIWEGLGCRGCGLGFLSFC